MSTAADVICLLDDEPSVLKALGRLLASEGLQTEKFTEPGRFLAYARDHEVSLAVIDIRMPDITGLEVQDVLHSIRPRARVIVMTAEDDPSHRAIALGNGAVAFFLKPLDGNLFIDAVRSALRRQPDAPE